MLLLMHLLLYVTFCVNDSNFPVDTLPTACEHGRYRDYYQMNYAIGSTEKFSENNVADSCL
jgi:hypothetical protein